MSAHPSSELIHFGPLSGFHTFGHFRTKWEHSRAGGSTDLGQTPTALSGVWAARSVSGAARERERKGGDPRSPVQSDTRRRKRCHPHPPDGKARARAHRRRHAAVLRPVNHGLRRRRTNHLQQRQASGMQSCAVFDTKAMQQEEGRTAFQGCPTPRILSRTPGVRAYAGRRIPGGKRCPKSHTPGVRAYANTGRDA
jgi:hypothetical protein